MDKAQKIHTRRRGKTEFPARTNMDISRLLKNITTNITLVQHYLKKKAIVKKDKE